MRIFCTALRVLGVVLGLFLVATSLTGIFVSMPGLNEIRLSSTERFVSGLPVLIFGILLLLPQTLFLRGKRHLFLMFSYVVLIVAAIPFVIFGVIAYYEGGKHWLIIPASFVLLTVPISNVLVLWYLRRRTQTPLNNSFKPKPLRDSV